LIRRATRIPQAPTDNADSVDYTFQQIEPYDNRGSVLELTYQVRTDNKGQRFESPAAGSAQAYVTTPDAGLSLLSEDVINSAGGILPIFHPAQPLLLLPLPIQPGGQFVSVAADPSSGQVTILQATVTRRARVDACGTIIEGWDVTGLERTTVAPNASTTVTSGPNPSSFIGEATAVDNIYATQFGGMPIAEHTLQATPIGTLSTDNAIGQEKPSPLPAGAA
jgi:hypothetical protein